MYSLKTKGIVLRRSNYGEADRILTIFTERFGKVKAIAKGVRKIKSKMAGSLEPFMLLDLQLYEGKTFYIVTGAVIEKEFPTISSDLKKTSQAFYVGELVDKFFEENNRHPDLFGIFADFLNHLNEKNGNDLIFKTFCLAVVEEAGFKPRIFECFHCHEKITAGKNYWDSVEGGIICSLCKEKTGHGREISESAVKVLRLIERRELSLTERVTVEKRVIGEVGNILDDYIGSILNKEMKSKKFVEDVKDISV